MTVSDNANINIKIIKTKDEPDISICKINMIYKKNRSYNRTVFLHTFKTKIYFTERTNALKASGSFIARSANTLRLRSILFSDNLCINSL